MPNHNSYGNDPRDARNPPVNGNGYGERVDPRNDPRNDPRDPRAQAQYDPRQTMAPRQQPAQASGAPELVPAGRYPVRAVNHKFGNAQNNTTTQIGVRVRIADGKYKGRTMLWYSSFTDNSDDITLRGMEALGFRGGDDIFDCRGFYDAKIQSDIPDAEAVVEHEPNIKTGVMQAKVKFINGGDIVMGHDLTPNDEQRFRQRMRATLARRNGSRGGPPSGSGQNQQASNQQPQQGGQGPMPWDDPNAGNRGGGYGR